MPVVRHPVFADQTHDVDDVKSWEEQGWIVDTKAKSAPPARSSFEEALEEQEGRAAAEGQQLLANSYMPTTPATAPAKTKKEA